MGIKFIGTVGALMVFAGIVGLLTDAFAPTAVQVVHVLFGSVMISGTVALVGAAVIQEIRKLEK
jgi:hypothetical protein